jgi:hypothetical protein
VKITVTLGRKIMGSLAQGEDLRAALVKFARECDVTLGEVRATGTVGWPRSQALNLPGKSRGSYFC